MSDTRPKGAYSTEQRVAACCRALAESVDSRQDCLETCRSSVQLLTTRLGVRQCSVMVSEDGSRLRLAAGASVFAAGPEREPRTGRIFRIGEGIAGEAARVGRPIVVQDVTRDPRWVGGVSAVDVRSLACLPLYAAGQLAGVLNLSHPEPGQYAEQPLAALDPFCLLLGQLLLSGHLRRTLLEVAHELNNRLVPVTICSEILMCSALDKAQMDQVRAIAHSAAGVRDILDVQLNSSSQRQPRKRPLDLNQLVTQTLSVIKVSLEQVGLRLELDLAQPLPELSGDPTQIEQTLINLVRNAEQAVIERQPTEGGRILVSTRQEDSDVVVRVRDNGCGIPPGDLNQIVQPFFTTKPPGQGSGLGLSVCQNIMNQHGGRIEVESRPGDTTVLLRFPTPVARTTEPDHPRESSTDVRVLLVDDDEVIRTIVTDVLRKHMQVDTASSGAEAIERLGANDYDVVVTDMRMRGLGGDAIHRWVVENRPELEQRMAFATGDTFDPTTNNFLMDKICLPKPYTGRDLLAVIRQLAPREEALAVAP